MASADGFTWLRHPETGNHFHAPDAAVDAWLETGWERTDTEPEPEPSPVVAEALRWRAEQARQQDTTSAGTSRAADKKGK